jgi:glycerol-3-phosphate dehydrogenase (NAD(P)+)
MPLKQRIAIIGAGSWGTALAIIAARAGHEVSLWSRTPEVAASINQRRHNGRYLTSATIPAGVVATTNTETAVHDASIVIIAAPSHAVRELLVTASSTLNPTSIIVSAAKGIEIDRGKRVSEIVNDVVGAEALQRFVCLSGPSFAEEVVANHPTAVVAASIDEKAAQAVQVALSFETLRIYTNTDVVGTEFGGAVKNVMAIAAGMVSGVGFGSNTLAALITRGLAEMSRLALFHGAQVETLMGLAGLGDLVLTCTGKLSRNRSVGEQLGRGKSLDEIVAGMNEVAEGIKTTLAVKQLADRAGLEMPITNEVKFVLYDGKSVQAAVSDLLSRPLKQEK